MKLHVSFLILTTLLAESALLGSPPQEQPPVPTAPVPAQILSARKVFISNAGEETPLPSPNQGPRASIRFDGMPLKSRVIN